ncbi:MAG: signal peptidase I [Treponema sp.]|jgi:signal peptidase I|nr:signal peptidase I [Treponema sp.]
MFDKWTQYSYAAQKQQRYQLIKFIFIFIILYVIYNCLTTFFFSVWTVENNTMRPGLNSGDRLLFSSFSPPAWLRNKNKIDNNPFPFKRGNIVLIDSRRDKEQKWPLRLVDSVVRFFTAQRASIFSSRGQYYIKRVIALPGDEISMNNYVFRVKAAGSSYSLTEFELSEKPYHPSIPKTSELWDDSVPFSDRMDTIILGPGECFVISDDRSNTNDSRTWGAISSSLITAKAVLRFWPIFKIELL